jgi:hypothetical protein
MAANNFLQQTATGLVPLKILTLPKVINLYCRQNIGQLFIRVGSADINPGKISASALQKPIVIYLLQEEFNN